MEVVGRRRKREMEKGRRDPPSLFPYTAYTHGLLISREGRKEGRKEREDWYLLWTLDSIAGLDLLVVVTVNVKGKSPHGQIFNLEASFAKRRKRTNNNNCFYLSCLGTIVYSCNRREFTAYICYEDLRHIVWQGGQAFMV